MLALLDECARIGNTANDAISAIRSPFLSSACSFPSVILYKSRLPYFFLFFPFFFFFTSKYKISNWRDNVSFLSKYIFREYFRSTWYSGKFDSSSADILYIVEDSKRDRSIWWIASCFANTSTDASKSQFFNRFFNAKTVKARNSRQRQNSSETSRAFTNTFYEKSLVFLKKKKKKNALFHARKISDRNNKLIISTVFNERTYRSVNSMIFKSKAKWNKCKKLSIARFFYENVSKNAL